MAEWQTRCLEGAVGVYLCGFKSRRPHKIQKRDETMLSSLLFYILIILSDERPKDFHSSKSDKIYIVDFITGKVETLGSTFRHETAGLLPSLCYYAKSINIYNFSVPINAQSDTLAPQPTIPQAQLVVQGFPYTNKYPFQYDLPHKYPP